MVRIMPDKLSDATGYISQAISWIWVMALAGWGGAVSYFTKLQTNGIPFSFLKFLMEIVTSAFVGVITFLICDASNLSWEVTAAMVGVSGHMGTRALFMIEQRYEMFIKGDGNGINR